MPNCSASRRARRRAFGTEVFPSGARDAFAEVSADGSRTWRPVTLPSPRGPAMVTAVAAMRGGFTAVGTFGAAGDGDVVVWTSSGGGWTMQVPNGTGLSGPGIHEITGLAASGGTLTGAGFTACESGEQPILWNVPAPVPTSPCPAPHVTSTEGNRASR